MAGVPGSRKWVVIGGGSIARAVAASLQAAGKDSLLLLRDAEAVQEAAWKLQLPARNRMARPFSLAPFEGLSSSSAQCAGEIAVAHAVPETFERLGPEEVKGVFICTPASGLPAATKTTLLPLLSAVQARRTERDAEAQRAADRQAVENPMFGAREAEDRLRQQRKQQLPPVVLFTRGMVRTGDKAQANGRPGPQSWAEASKVRKEISFQTPCKYIADQCEPLRNADALPCPIFTVAGPIIAEEWEEDSRSALDVREKAVDDASEDAPASEEVPVPSATQLYVGVGADVSFAAVDSLAKQFRREWMEPLDFGERQHDGAEALAVLNAASMVVAWVAGTLGCLGQHLALPTCSVHYHAQVATNALLELVLHQKCSASLQRAVATQLLCAFVAPSPERRLGQLSVECQTHDRLTDPSDTARSLQDAVWGIAQLLGAKQSEGGICPSTLKTATRFFNPIVDTYFGERWPAEMARYVVGGPKSYGWNETTPDTPFLRQVRKLDKAVIEGGDFERAKHELVSWMSANSRAPSPR